jgi:hypothetical protein
MGNAGTFNDLRHVMVKTTRAFVDRLYGVCLVANRPAVGLPKLSRRSKILIGIGVLVLLVLALGSRAIDTYVSWEWFGEVGFREVFSTIVLTKVVLFFAVGALIGGLVALAMVITYRTRPVFVPVSGVDDPLSRYRTTIVRRLKLVGIGVPALVGVISGWAAVGQWQMVQLFLNGEPFGTTDPQFHIDIGFYAFTLPFILWLKNLLFIGIVLSFFAALIGHYIFGGIRLAGRGGQLSSPARVHLALLVGFFVLLKAAAYFLDRYEVLYSDRNDKFNGATYTDIHALLPAKLILLCIAVFCAIAFFVGAFLKNLQLPAIAIVLMLLSAILIGTAWPAIMEQFSVSANANQKEAPYISRNIEATRQAYGITPDKIDTQNYDPAKSNASVSQIEAQTGTMSNVRLLDPNILSPTFTQLAAGNKNFYGFPDKLSIDRYKVGNKTQDYIVAAREIDPTKLANNQRDWINRHLVYTHGNGFVAAPANKINTNDQGGYPDISVSDLNTPGQGGLHVTQPRIYYGLLAGAPDNYAIVDGAAKGREYDADGQNFTYDGSGGISIGNWFNRLVFAANYGERNILFSDQISDKSKILINRNPRQRVEDVAPWLTVDGNAYPAVVDGRIKWIIDGYTTLDRYPYSEQTPLGDVTNVSNTGGSVAAQPNRRIGYIRNSVKATVDAYSGKVDLYGVDDKDPVLKAWSKVFPGTIKPASEVSPELRAHFRYPEDLFKVQRELLAKYHVSDPQQFYSTQSFWSVPPDPTTKPDGTANSLGNLPNQGAPAQPPYYILAEVPGQRKPEFQLTSSLTPLNRQNMAAWMSVSSDPGDYGKFTVLRLPDQTQTNGPIQVQNLFESTPKVTENRTLFNNNQVEAKFGNLLTLPVAGGILYVEPVYIQQKDANAFPQLAKVLVSFNGKVGFDDTLDKALADMTGTTATPQPGGGSTQPAPSSSTPQPGAPSSELSASVQDIQNALAQVRTAQQSGDFAALGTAYQKLDAATKRFEAAKKAGSKSGGGASTSSSPPR